MGCGEGPWATKHVPTLPTQLHTEMRGTSVYSVYACDMVWLHAIRFTDG